MVEMIKNWIETSEKMKQYETVYNNLVNSNKSNNCFETLSNFENCTRYRNGLENIFEGFGGIAPIPFLQTHILEIIFLSFSFIFIYILLSKKKNVLTPIKIVFCKILALAITIIPLFTYVFYSSYMHAYNEKQITLCEKSMKIFPFEGEYSDYEILLKSVLDEKSFLSLVLQNKVGLNQQNTSNSLKDYWVWDGVGVHYIPHLKEKVYKISPSKIVH